MCYLFHTGSSTNEMLSTHSNRNPPNKNLTSVHGITMNGWEQTAGHKYQVLGVQLHCESNPVQRTVYCIHAVRESRSFGSKRDISRCTSSYVLVHEYLHWPMKQTTSTGIRRQSKCPTEKISLQDYWRAKMTNFVIVSPGQNCSTCTISKYMVYHRFLCECTSMIHLGWISLSVSVR